MKANELRMGNLVMGISNTPEIITCIDYETVNTDNHDILLHNQIEPIELNDKWLKKLGFERLIGWDDMIFWRVEVNKQHFDLEENMQGYEYDMWINLKHVHQLQNLYFALTGQELNINS